MSERTKVVIIGGKGTAVNIAEQIYDAQHQHGMNVEVLGFAFDDEAFGDEINGFPVVCKTYEARAKFEQYNDVKYIFNLYRTDLIRERAALMESYEIPENKYYTFVHPSAYIAKSAKIGNGCVIQSFCVINSNVVIGNHNTFNTSVLVGHDTKIGNHNFFAARSVIGSGLTIKNYVFTGLNSSLKNQITVEDGALIGMGSNALHSIPENQIVIGNPARPIVKK